MDWRAAVDRIAREVGVSWPRRSDRSSFDIDEFLDDTLVHMRVGQKELATHPAIHEWTIAAYEALLELGLSPMSNSARAKLDVVRSQFEQASLMFGSALIDYEVRLDEMRGEVNCHREQSEHLRLRCESLSSDLAIAETEASRFSSQVANAVDERQSLAEELERQRAETQLRTADLENQTEQLNEVNAKLSQSVDENSALRAEAAAQAADLAASAEERSRIAEESQRLERALSEATAAQSDLLARAEKSERQVAQTAREKNELTDELASYKARFAASAKERSRFAEKLQRAELALSEAATVRSNLVARTAELAQARVEASVADAEIERYAKELAEARGELARKDEISAQYVAAATEQAADMQRFEQRMRVVGIKQAVEHQINLAAHETRVRMASSPLGLVPYQRRLRSAAAPTLDLQPLGRSERYEIEKSGLFDSQWYLEVNPDVAQSGMDPFAHYLRNGFRENRDPHPYFCSAWYMALNAADIGATAPLVHYLRNGKSRFRSPHPLFDASFYAQVNEDAAAKNLDPLEHYINFGEGEMRDPHPLIWVDRLRREPGFDDIDRPVRAYVTRSELFRSSPHPLFDAELYLHENNDVRRQGICPLLHYCAIGWREGRRPHRAFAGDWYLVNNPDVAGALINPLVHFVRFGSFEKRSPHPLFDVDFYLRINEEARIAPYDALSHYVLVGAQDQRETTERICLADMQSIVPDVYWRRFDALSAFMDFGETHVPPPSKISVRTPDVSSSSASPWPPEPSISYWLPQRLRDYIIDIYGEAKISLYLYLMSVVERYGDRPDDFANSLDFELLTNRLRGYRSSRRSQRAKIDVSIIIPVYNNLVFTLTSVISILENASHYSYEIIIGDDCSTDATAEVFSKSGGVVHVRHKKNLGFLGNCNSAAMVARGDYVVFLNNDTLTLPHWLDELIDAFRRAPDCGLSGSKLLNGDGTLQEAGGIFWEDGSAWNFGRNSNPRLPEFNYVKETDYISGASVALPRKVWKELGGFDSIFAPAYCEDSDLAFRVRAAGMKTIYAAHSEVIHHEGKSHGTDTSSGIKAYQVANQEKLLARWRSALAAHHFPNAHDVFLARDRSRGRPHILIIDHYIPQWDRDAGSRTMYHFIRMFLASGFHVTFWPDNLNEDREYCRPLQNEGVEVIYSSAYADRFDTFVSENGRYFEYALLSRPDVAIKYSEELRKNSKCRILYYGHDIHYRRMELEFELNPNPDLRLEIETMRGQEFANWRKSDVVLYPSADEREEVNQALPGCVAADVPMLGYLPEELSTARENLARFEKRDFDELLFVGGSHPPNVDALVWFVTEVMPLVRAERPSTRLNVVGSTSSSEIAQLESESVVLRGRLSDEELAKLYATVGLAVIPLRFGGGVKGKTIEALFHATPFVATAVGMQGLFPPEPIGYVAVEAQAFADAVLRAQTDRRATRKNVEQGLLFIENYYSIDALRRAFAPFVPHIESAIRASDDHGALSNDKAHSASKRGRRESALAARSGRRR